MLSPLTSQVTVGVAQMSMAQKQAFVRLPSIVNWVVNVHRKPTKIEISTNVTDGKTVLNLCIHLYLC